MAKIIDLRGVKVTGTILRKGSLLGPKVRHEESVSPEALKRNRVILAIITAGFMALLAVSFLAG